jgi:hypothetical protein
VERCGQLEQVIVVASDHRCSANQHVQAGPFRGVVQVVADVGLVDDPPEVAERRVVERVDDEEALEAAAVGMVPELDAAMSKGAAPAGT